MPLTLITGPANAAKAGALLDAYGDAIDRSPILVVPNFGDVDFYRRDLALRGEVFGTNVVQFRALISEIGRRAGVRKRPVGALARERVAARAVSKTDLNALAAAAATPGFAGHLVDFVAEIEAARVDPGRLIAALRSWGEGGDYAEEVGRLYSAYRDELDRLNRPDRELLSTSVLDALRETPQAWGGTPVLFYGFDELDPIQFDAVETLSRHADADVWFSLTHEPGREALAARARTYEDLKPLSSDELALPANDEYYESPALHAIERGLMVEDAEQVAPHDALELLEGGGERAEAELVAGRVAALIADGTKPEEIAVVHRDIDSVAPLIDRVFSGYGIPVSLRRKLKAGHTALGRGLIAAIRCAVLKGTADDLVTYLRTPGLVDRSAFVDALEVQIRKGGIKTAEGARKLWEAEHWKLEALDRIAGAARRDHPALYEWLAGDISFLLARPHIRQAPVLSGAEEIDARTASALQASLRELAALPPQLAPDTRELVDSLYDLDVYVGADPAPGRVTVAGPLSVRARRVQALFAMGMAQGTFPRGSRPQPFFDDAERRAINAASGLRLRLRERSIQTERFFFYLTCSRPRKTLALSWPAANDDGKPIVRSLFVDDLLGLLSKPPAVQRRALGEAGWESAAPTAREQSRAEVAAQPGRAAAPIASLSDAALVRLRERETWSASALESWMSCPVKWFVERHLRPEAFEPDPEAMLRGNLSHKVLEKALKGLGKPLTPADLPRAKELLHEALSDQVGDVPISVNAERLAAESRRLEVDLLAYLEHSAANNSEFIPSEFELEFGRAEDPYPALELGDGSVKLQGRIDRLDVSADGKEALVWDYKGRGEQPGRKAWGPPPDHKGKIQIALYMLAVQRVVKLEVVGGLYQRMKAADPQPRGMVIGEADPNLPLKKDDRVDAEAALEVLALCEQAALDAVAEIREGRLVGRPKTCAYQGRKCDYPSICRCEESDL